MKIYRAMCKNEYEDTIKGNLSWNSRFKWFGTFEFITERVKDNKFNNSKFVKDRYKYLLEFEIEEKMLKLFNRCGHREYMLDRRKANNFKFIVREIT
jgi:hypothetical protein